MSGLRFTDQEIRMKELTTREDKEAAYALRHKIFAEELGWVSIKKDKREIDCYDEKCKLIGIFIHNRLIACLRIILPNQQFMIEKEFKSIVSCHEIEKTEKTIEVTRFCIASDVRKGLVSTKFGTFPIIMSLEKAFYNWCKINKMDQ